MKIGQFDEVDDSDDPGAFAAHTDVVRSLDAITAAKAWTDERLAGARLRGRALDVGCGTGEDLPRLQHLLGGDAVVIGIDPSRTMLAEARDRQRREPNLPLVRADGARLPFANHAFAGARVDRVLLHVPSPADVVGEMARVVAPGGRVVALEPDFETGVIGVPGHESVQRRLKDAQMRTLARNPAVGRTLTALLHGAGLVDVVIEGWVSIVHDHSFAVAALGLDHVIGADEVDYQAALDAWRAAIDTAAAEGSFFSALTFFAACGTKVG